jgi:hypothetical protein
MDEGSGSNDVGLAGGQLATTAIKDWLRSINVVLAVYSEAFSTYGYENVGMLLEAEQSELEEACREIGVKKPHRRAILAAFAKLEL